VGGVFVLQLLKTPSLGTRRGGKKKEEEGERTGKGRIHESGGSMARGTATRVARRHDGVPQASYPNRTELAGSVSRRS